MSLANTSFTVCPVCQSNDVSSLLQVKDYSLTQEHFQIIECDNCSMRFTNPIPSVEEIALYYDFPDYISHTDSTKGWMHQLYHKVRNHTLIQKTNWIQSLFTGYKGQILDIGAGTGAFANAMQNKGWKVTALEPDEASRNRALQNYGLQLLPSDELFNLPENTFDVITLWHVLEHVHALKPYIQSFQKLLKPNGRLIIAVPNYNSYDATFYKQFWAAYDVPRHLYHFAPPSMRYLMKKQGLEVIDIKPMWFDSFYVGLLSEKYKKSGKIGVIRAFLVGLWSNLKAVKNNEKGSSLLYTIRKQRDLI